jgi:hypothetical protein
MSRSVGRTDEEKNTMSGRELQFAPNDGKLPAPGRIRLLFWLFERDPDYESYAAQVRKCGYLTQSLRKVSTQPLWTATIYIAQGLFGRQATVSTPMTLLDLANVVGAIDPKTEK